MKKLFIYSYFLLLISTTTACNQKNNTFHETESIEKEQQVEDEKVDGDVDRPIE